MTELQDPVDVFRQSLDNLPRTTELHPPLLERAEVRPYPDLSRIWVRVQISPFATYPNLALTLLGPDGGIVSNLFVVEAREPYQSLTLHLRQPPIAGEQYQLEIELSRDDRTLDTRRISFALDFKEPFHGIRDE
jgi:hypothetical protein